MAITPNDPANFTPTMGNYTELRPFRFWCQKILPMVYDDSLSYYELLCKVIDFLNKTMEDVEVLNTDVENVYNSFELLQEYVNNYFETLDVQEEIDNKLDDMAESGALTTLIEPLIPALITGWLNDHITPTSPPIDNTLTVSGAGADSKTVGDKFNVIHDAPLIAVESDLNEILTSGLYRINSDAVNAPDGWNNSFPSYLEVIKTKNALYTVQVFRDYYRGVFYYRFYGGNPLTWSNWRLTYDKRIIDTIHDIHFMSISSDLNTFLTSGVYRVNENVTNAPNQWNNTFPAYLEVMKTKDAVYTLQIFSDYYTGTFYYRFYGGSPATWSNWRLTYDKGVLNTLVVDVEKKLDATFIAENTDLNTLLTSGLYRVNVGAVNAPSDWDDTFPSYVEVIKTKDARYTVQVFKDYYRGVFYYRFYGSDPPVWSNWRLTYDKNSVDAMLDSPILEVDSDLDDLHESGIYRANYGLVNAPEDWGESLPAFIKVVKTKDARYTIQIFEDFINGTFHWRYYGNYPFEWYPWREIYSQNENNNRVDSIIGTTFSKPDVENNGTIIKVMSYNVANYNNDTNVYLPDDKRHNFKNMLSYINPDIICLQESDTWIDGSSQNKDSRNYLYYPVYPYMIGGNSTQIVSKKRPTIYGQVKDSFNRFVRYTVTPINNKSLLILSIHAIARHNNDPSESLDSPASIADRKTEYEEILGWINGVNTLPDYGTGDAVSVPEHDWCIIGGDFNTVSATDKNNLLTEINKYGYTSANGGWLDWIETNRNKTGYVRFSVDNILCSPDIIINSITSYTSLYKYLYSDHYPFVAEVTLL